MAHITEVNQQDALVALVNHVYQALTPLEKATFKYDLGIVLSEDGSNTQAPNQELSQPFSKMPEIRKWILAHHDWFWNHPKMGKGVAVTRKAMIGYVMDIYPLVNGDRKVLENATSPRFHDQFGGAIGHKSILGTVLERVDTGEYRVIRPASAIK